MKRRYWDLIITLVALYFFFLSIELLGRGLKLLGKDFVYKLLLTTKNPFSGLFIGILVTSIVQSSSGVTSIVVGMVGNNILSLRNAIPILMGANIGTTVTNTLVALSFISSKQKLSQVFPSAIVHDFFNLLTILVLFPLEISFSLLEKSSYLLAQAFKGVGGIHISNFLKLLLNPVAKPITALLARFPVVLIISSVILLFSMLRFLVNSSRRLISGRVEVLLDRYIFVSPFKAFLLGLFFTAIIQSSSITTSLIIPLVAAGVLDLIRIYPYTLGANIGTTITAIFASLATGSLLGNEAAFCHSLFNIFGCLIWYPLRVVPLSLATQLGRLVGKGRHWAIVYTLGIFFLIPILLILLIRR